MFAGGGGNLKNFDAKDPHELCISVFLTEFPVLMSFRTAAGIRLKIGYNDDCNTMLLEVSIVGQVHMDSRRPA